MRRSELTGDRAASAGTAVVGKSSGIAGEFVLPAISILGILLVWQAIATAAASRFLPSPLETIAVMLGSIRDGTAFFHVGVTLARVIAGFAIAMTIGVILGTCMGLSRAGERLLRLPVIIGMTIPSLCYIIVVFIWIGLNERAAILAVALTTFPSIAINIWSGVKAIDQRLIGMAKAFGSNAWDTTVKVILPQVFPYIVAASRFGFGIVWKVVAVVELLGLSSGVGFQLNYYFQLFDVRAVFAWTMLFTIVMVMIEFLVFKPIEQWVFRWRPDVRI